MCGRQITTGMSEHDVMTLAGHSNFATTHGFYIAVNNDLVDRARQASVKGVCNNLAQIWHKCPSGRDIKKANKHKGLLAKNLKNTPGRTRTCDLRIRNPQFWL